MKKNKNIFDRWNIEKQIINKGEKIKFFVNTREIWFVKMGQNIGYEENGKDNFLRPVLVLKKVGNMFFTASLTSRGKENHKFYYKLRNPDFHNSRHQDSSYIILSQARIMDKRRFVENMGFASREDFQKIKEKLRTLLL